MQSGSVAAYSYPFKKQILITASRTLTSRDLQGVLVVDSSAGPITLTLPRANTVRAGGLFHVLATTGATNPVTVVTQAGDTYNNGQIAPIILTENGQPAIILGTEQATAWLASFSAGFLEGSLAEVFFTEDYNTSMGSFRTRSQGASASFQYTFQVPADFGSLIELVAVGIPLANLAGVDIDLFSDYGAAGEPFNNHSESETTATYNFTLNELSEIDISPVYSVLAAGDYCGLEIDHNGIGGTIEYIGIRLRYARA